LKVGQGEARAAAPGSAGKNGKKVRARTGKMLAYFGPDEATDRLAREVSDYI